MPRKTLSQAQHMITAILDEREEQRRFFTSLTERAAAKIVSLQRRRDDHLVDLKEQHDVEMLEIQDLYDNAIADMTFIEQLGRDRLGDFSVADNFEPTKMIGDKASEASKRKSIESLNGDNGE